MTITFQLIGEIAVWMFIAELIVLFIFKKSGSQFKFRLGEFTPGLNPYIKKSKYIMITLIIFFLIGLIQNTTMFMDNLIKFVGNPILLYLIAFSFDIFFIAKELAGLNFKNRWVYIPLFISLGLFILAMILK